jgi:hypothetical protein
MTVKMKSFSIPLFPPQAKWVVERSKDQVSLIVTLEFLV